MPELLTLQIDYHQAGALRAILRDRADAVEGSLRIVPCRTPITAAEFYAMEAADFPSDLRTVLIEQIRGMLQTLEAALA